MRIKGLYNDNIANCSAAIQQVFVFDTLDLFYGTIHKTDFP
jgi:hypothetical protein